MKQNDFIDLVKFVLALMVVAIHSGLYIGWNGYNVLWPWLRIAVPLFFIISSYFFFSRIAIAEDGGSAVLKKFVKRNLVLYWGWFLILLPVTLLNKHASWFCDGGWIRFLRNVFLGSTFTASWFLTALLFAIILVYFAQKWLNYLAILLIGLLSYIWCTMVSSYGFWINDVQFLSQIKVVMGSWNPSPHFSFMSALLWVAIGLGMSKLKPESFFR